MRLSALAALALLPACATVAEEAPFTQATDTGSPMLTVLTSNDPETQLMALVLTKAALEKGVRPRILLCSAAGDLALKKPPASALAPLQPKGASPAGLLRGLRAAGVKVEVCAIYLPNRPFGAEALEDGVGIATPSDIAEVLTTEGATVLNF
jgi:predicted peroxiredoxin